MSNSEDPRKARREAETAKAKHDEGYGAVPNATPGQPADEAEQLKEAMHQLEEEKGDWGKDH
jgi:hypothetical protein